MKAPSARELMSQTVIVLAVCAGVSLGVLQPLKSRLSAERAQLAADQSLVAQHQAMRFHREEPPRRARNERLRAQLREMAAPAESAASLHNTLMMMARETGVTIEAVEPRQITAPASAPGGAGAASLSAPTSAFSAGITGQGSYEAIAAFLCRLEKTGMARLVSGQVSPQHGAGVEPAARFALTTVHFGFSAPDAPAQAAASGGGS